MKQVMWWEVGLLGYGAVGRIRVSGLNVVSWVQNLLTSLLHGAESFLRS